MTRKQMVEKIMKGFSQILTAEQYRKLELALLIMPDDAFNQMIEDSIRSAQQKNPAHYYNMGLKLREHFGVNNETSALSEIPAEFLPADIEEELWEAINRSHPSETIRLNKAEDIAICSQWQSKASDGTIPSDLFFTGKNPLMDCTIIVDETGETNGEIIEYRVVVFSDYQERIRNAGEEPVYVGAIVFSEYPLFLPMGVCKGVPIMMTGPLGYHGDSPKTREKLTQLFAVQMGYELLSTWYGIQMSRGDNTQ